MSCIELIIGCFATWRLTCMLHGEPGPWKLVSRVRRGLELLGARDALQCHYCLSVWLAAPIAAGLVEDTVGRLILWPALSAGSIVIERLTGHLAPATYEFENVSDSPVPSSGDYR